MRGIITILFTEPDKKLQTLQGGRGLAEALPLYEIKMHF